MLLRLVLRACDERIYNDLLYVKMKQKMAIHDDEGGVNYGYTNDLPSITEEYAVYRNI